MSRATILISVAIVFLQSTNSWAQSDGCTIGNDLLEWHTVIPKPLPAEKTVEPGRDVQLNSAVQADVTKEPFVHMGRFLSSVDNEKRYCVAQFVENADILLTAAHCVRNKSGVWLDRFSFTTARGAKTVNSARCIATKSSWVTGQNGTWYWPADYAFIILNEKLGSGYLRINRQIQPGDGSLLSVGQPLAIDFGKSLYVVSGSALHATEFGRRLAPGEGQGIIIHGEPRFTLGISGGGWIAPPTKEDPSRFRVVGLNATTSDLPIATLGPIVGPCALDLLNYIQTQCPRAAER